MIESARLNLNHDLARAWSGIGNITQLKLARLAVGDELDGFHGRSV